MQQTLRKSDSLSRLGSQSLTKGHMSKMTARQVADKKRQLLSVCTPFVSVGVLVGKNVKSNNDTDCLNQRAYQLMPVYFISGA